MVNLMTSEPYVQCLYLRRFETKYNKVEVYY